MPPRATKRIPGIWLLFSLSCLAILPADALEPCEIEVIDKENGWPVPLVELSTTNDLKFVTDNAGIVAFDAPEFMDRETWLSVFSHGYQVEADGFGNRGVRFTPKPGGKFKIKIERKQIAKRLGRLTGAGIFAESQKLGSPEGPWGPAVKIMTHQNYSFYNVQIDWQLTSPDEPVILFEGTYTTTFTDNKIKTPRYDYNQMLYRLDLDDPALKPARNN